MLQQFLHLSNLYVHGFQKANILVQLILGAALQTDLRQAVPASFSERVAAGRGRHVVSVEERMGPILDHGPHAHQKAEFGILYAIVSRNSLYYNNKNGGGPWNR